MIINSQLNAVSRELSTKFADKNERAHTIQNAMMCVIAYTSCRSIELRPKAVYGLNVIAALHCLTGDKRSVSQMYVEELPGFPKTAFIDVFSRHELDYAIAIESDVILSQRLLRTKNISEYDSACPVNVLDMSDIEFWDKVAPTLENHLYTELNKISSNIADLSLETISYTLHGVLSAYIMRHGLLQIMPNKYVLSGSVLFTTNILRDDILKSMPLVLGSVTDLSTSKIVLPDAVGAVTYFSRKNGEVIDQILTRLKKLRRKFKSLKAFTTDPKYKKWFPADSHQYRESDLVDVAETLAHNFLSRTGSDVRDYFNPVSIEPDVKTLTSAKLKLKDVPINTSIDFKEIEFLSGPGQAPTYIGFSLMHVEEQYDMPFNSPQEFVHLISDMFGYGSDPYAYVSGITNGTLFVDRQIRSRVLDYSSLQGDLCVRGPITTDDISSMGQSHLIDIIRRNSIILGTSPAYRLSTMTAKALSDLILGYYGQNMQKIHSIICEYQLYGEYGIPPVKLWSKETVESASVDFLYTIMDKLGMDATPVPTMSLRHRILVVLGHAKAFSFDPYLLERNELVTLDELKALSREEFHALRNYASKLDLVDAEELKGPQQRLIALIERAVRTIFQARSA